MTKRIERGLLSRKGIGKRVQSWMLILVLIISMLPQAAKRAEAVDGMKVIFHNVKGITITFNNGTPVTPTSDDYTYTFNSSNDTSYAISCTVPDHYSSYALYSDSNLSKSIKKSNNVYTVSTDAYSYIGNNAGYWKRNENGIDSKGVTTLNIYYSATPTEYTITWNANGGTISGTAPTKYTYAADGGVTKFPTATYPNGNRDFIGWYSDSALTHLVTALPDSSVDGNATLYAGYGSEYTEYKFYDVNGDLIDRQVIRKGDRLRRPEAPAVDEDKEEFLGWFDKASGKEIDFDTPSRFSSTVQVQAKVEPVYHVYIMTEQFGTSGSEYRSVFRTLNAKPSNSYKVTIPNDYQGTVGTAEYYYDSADTDPSKANGFIPTQEYTVGPSGDLKPNQELYPFLVDSFWVTFFTNGAENEIDSVLVANGNTLDLTKVNTPIKNKYLFDGWYDNPGFTGSALTKITPTSNVYLYAKYKIDTSKTSKYTIVYWGENADNPGYSTMGKPTVISTTTDSEIKLNNTTIALPSGTTDSSYMELDLVKSNITKSGKEYITGKKVTADDSTVINVFYKRIQYTIKADFSGKDIDTSTLPEGTATGIVYMNGGSAETRDAYAYYNATEKAYYLVAKKDQTFSGLWPRPYSADGTQIVKQYGNWATTRHSMTSDMCEDSSNYTNIITPTWTDASGKKTTVTYYLETLNGAEDEGATLHNGRYYSKINKYTETFVYSGSLSPKTITGYNTGSGSNNTFYYTRKSYKLNLVNYGDSKQYTTRYGEDITKYIGQAPARPTLAVDPARNAEYIFVGWFTVEPEMVSYDATWDATAGKWVPVTGSTEPFYGNTMPDVGDDNSTFTLYAYWWHPPVDIDINVNIISNNVIFTVPYEHSMTDVDDYEVSPGYNGYDGLLKFIDANDKILIHWADKYGNIVDPNKKLTEDTEIFAVFLDDGYTVTYDEGDATVESGESLPVDDKLYQVGSYAIAKSPDHLIAPDDDATSDLNDKKVFAGWKNSVNGEVYYPGESIPVATDVTLTAVYESNTEYYKLTYYKNDGSTDAYETEEVYVVNDGLYQSTMVDYDSTGLGKRHAAEALGWGDDAAATAPVSEFRVSSNANNNKLFMLWSPMDKITIEGKVVWEDDKAAIRPDSVDVSLYQQIPGGSKEMVTDSTTPVTGDEWTFSYADLHPYTSDDKEIDYTVQEETLDLYETVITGNMDDGYVITNTFNGYWIEYEGTDGAAFSGTNPIAYNEATATFTLNNPSKEGYEFLGWTGTGLSAASKEVQIPTGSSGDRTYTANWQAEDQEITYNSEKDGKNNSDPSKTTTVPYDELIKVVVGDGTWTAPDNLVATTDDGVYIVKGAISMPDPVPTETDAMFVGWEVENGTGDIAKVFTARYETDTYGGKDGNGEDIGDGIPDKYQVLVTYQVVNGTWSDDTTADITEYVTLKDANGKWSESGSADISATKPTGMKANTGYGNGAWNNTSNTVTVSTPSTTFIYTFSPIAYSITYILNGGDVTGNPTEYTIESAAIKLNNPSRTGYTFEGWTGTGLSAATNPVNIPSGSIGDRVYTANWKADSKNVIYSPVQDKDAVPDDAKVELCFDDLIKIVYEPGVSWTAPYSLEATAETGVYRVFMQATIPDPIPADGDIFLGWEVTDGTGNIKKIFTAKYAEDNLGGKDGNGNDKGDGIPDKYQVLVTYKIVHGTWNDDTTADIKEYVTLKDTSGKWSETGSAAITKPTGMKANTGYEKGAWDNTATTVTKTSNLTFVHTFTAITYTISYEGLDGATVSGNPDSYTVESADITLNNPTKEGYTFLGWTGTNLTEASKSVTIASGSVGNRSYTATWQANDKSVTYSPVQTDDNEPNDDAIVLKYDDKIQVIYAPGTWTYYDPLKPTATDGIFIVKGNVTIVDPTPKDGYVFLGWKVDKPASGDIKAIFTAQYETDKVGDKDGSGNDKGDGIPDKYQVLVTYKVVNGTWSDDTTADIKEYVTLKDANGKWSETGTGTLNKPAGMKANTGYENGVWDDTATTVTEAKTFTYAYVPTEHEITYPPVQDEDNDPSDEDLDVKYDEKIQVIYTPGSWTKPSTLEQVGSTDVYIIKGDVELSDPTPEDGYVFLGWDIDVPASGDIKAIFTAKYEGDEVGGKDGSGNDKGDGIPDKYQVLVTYKIVHGTWNDDTTADIKEYVTLKDTNGKWSETGTGTLNKPAGMKANTGYENGAWDDTATTVTEAKTFTYAYVPTEHEITYPPVQDDDTEPSDDDLDVKYDDKIRVIYTPGSWTMPSTLEQVGSTDVYVIKGNVELSDPTPEAGYVFLGWDIDVPASGDIKAIFTAKYEGDEVGGKDGSGNDKGDGIPDKYQVLVTYKVVNGTWSDDTTADIKEYVTLKDTNGKWSETGTGTLNKPAGMKANTGYENGAWDDTATTVTEAKTFTYAYVPTEHEITYPPVQDDDTEPSDDDLDVKYDDKIRVIYTPGSWTMPSTLEQVGSTDVYIIKGDVELSDPTPETGSVFLGWDINVPASGDIKAIFTAKYEGDEVGGKDGSGNDKGDGIPDKYQVLVTYKVVHGTWNDDTTADIKEYVTLKDTNGKWSETGTGTLNKPAGMKANTGYENGVWDDTATTVTAAKTFTYAYVPTEHEITYPPVQDEDTDPSDEDLDVKYDDKIRVIYTPGTWTKPSTLEQVGSTDVYIIKGDVELSDPTPEDGYVFLGWDIDVPASGDIKAIFTAQYEGDEVGGKDGSGNDKGDGIPDKYQVLVTYKVVNGTWSDDTTADIKEYVTLKDTNGKWSETGSAAITKPVGMKANTGYENGAWNDSATTVTKTSNLTFTHTFTVITYTIDYEGIDGATVSGNPDSYTVESADITLNNPTKEGYTFLGWTGTDLSSASFSVTIASGSIGNRSYTATWQANDKNVTYSPVQTDDNEPNDDAIVLKYDDKIQVIYAPGTWNYYDPLKPTATDGIFIVKGNVSIVDPTPATGYVFIGWDVKDGTGDIRKIFTAQYETDNYGGKDGNGNDKGDGIPDKYQMLVTYRIVNGTWSDNTSADKTEYVTLKDASGKWDANGSADISETKPAGMKANTGYSNGLWSSDATTVTKTTPTMPFVYTYNALNYTISYEGIDGATVSGNPDSYTIESADITLNNPTKEGYVFLGWTGTELTEASKSVKIAAGSYGNRSYTATWQAAEQKITYSPEQTDEEEPDDEDETVHYDDVIQIIAEPGTMDDPEHLEETGTPGTYTVKGDVVLKDPTPPEESIFIGWKVEDGSGNVKKVFTAQYETDKLGKKDKNGKDIGDGIPDIYQKEFCFQVVNGTWSDGTTDDIYILVTFYDNMGNWSIDGKAYVDDPSGMIPFPGYGRGVWTPELEYDKLMLASNSNFLGALAPAGLKVILTRKSDIIHKFVFVPDGYTIKYENVDGAEMKDNPNSYTVLSDTIVLNNPTKNGYVFKGWTGTGLSDLTMTVTIPKGSTGNRTYTAHWEKKDPTPPTGDRENPYMYFLLLIVSGIALTFMMLFGRKRRRLMY